MRKRFIGYPRIIQTTIVSLLTLLLLIVGVVGTSALAHGATAAGTSAPMHTATMGRASLQHTPTGTVNLHADRHVLTVTITLIGLAPNSTHPAHIHVGNSCASNGAILYPLNNVVADAKGQASVTTFVHISKPGIPAMGWYVNVHNGPTLATPHQANAIACGVISNTYNASDVLTFLGPTSSPNQHAAGYTNLYIKNGRLVVHIIVTGLAPYSKHAAHIHAGNCFYTRQVLFDLSPLVANAQGVASKTESFNHVTSIPASGWVVNVHFSTDLSTQTGYDPILCGNVINA